MLVSCDLPLFQSREIHVDHAAIPRGAKVKLDCAHIELELGIGDVGPLEVPFKSWDEGLVGVGILTGDF